MHIKHIIFIISITIILPIQAQQYYLSNVAKVSIITIGPGDYVYDSFGHSAFRIKDDEQNIDLAFNYGVFDFNTPNFYSKYAQGRLKYMLGVANFNNFLESYKIQNRWMQEQELILSKEEKQQFFAYLMNNAKPENKYYIYDSFYNNCATKIRDVSKDILKEDLIFSTSENFKQKTFRQLVHKYLNRNSWSCFGIDLALGAITDKIATPEEHMYMPEYVSLFFKNATRTNGNPITAPSKTLITAASREHKSIFITSPFMVFGSIALLILLITYSNYRHHKISKWLDIFLLGFTGITGILVFLLWVATDHVITTHNYNLLWAFPLNSIILFFVIKKQPKQWLVKYFKFLVIILFLLAIHWTISIQIFPIALLPFFIALAVRYSFLIYYFNQKNNLLTNRG